MLSGSSLVHHIHGDPAIEEWAKEILLREFRGDQEAFDAIRDRLADRLAIMPRRFQRLRLEREYSDALVIHWTGASGKKKNVSFNSGKETDTHK